MQSTNPGETELVATTTAQIHETLGQIYDIIDKVGTHLEETFQTQEDRFLEEYRKQMYSAQKNLREYTKTHSQAELTKKIEEKERALRRKRETSLHQTTNYSNKVKSLKTTATNLKQTLDNLKDEINFVDEQLILSEEKNRRLDEEAKYLKIEILKHRPDFEFWEEDILNGGILENKKEPFANKMGRKGSYPNQLLNSVDSGRRAKVSNYKIPVPSMKKIAALKQGGSGYKSADDGYVEDGEIERWSKIHQAEKRNNNILNRINNDPSFFKGKFEEIFEDCIKKALGGDKTFDNSEGKLPRLSQSAEVLQYNEGELSQMDTNMMVDKLRLAEMKLTNQDRKVMIEEFLGSQDVKEYLYKKFIEESNKKPISKHFSKDLL